MSHTAQSCGRAAGEPETSLYGPVSRLSRRLTVYNALRGRNRRSEPAETAHIDSIKYLGALVLYTEEGERQRRHERSSATLSNCRRRAYRSERWTVNLTPEGFPVRDGRTQGQATQPTSHLTPARIDPEGARSPLRCSRYERCAQRPSTTRRQHGRTAHASRRVRTGRPVDSVRRLHRVSIHTTMTAGEQVTHRSKRGVPVTPARCGSTDPRNVDANRMPASSR